MGWDGTGWDGTGWDGMGWTEQGRWTSGPGGRALQGGGGRRTMTHERRGPPACAEGDALSRGSPAPPCPALVEVILEPGAWVGGTGCRGFAGGWVGRDASPGGARRHLQGAAAQAAPQPLQRLAGREALVGRLTPGEPCADAARDQEPRLLPRYLAGPCKPCRLPRPHAWACRLPCGPQSPLARQPCTLSLSFLGHA